VLEPTTPALACAWQDRLRSRLDPAIDRAVTEFADLLPGLGEAQFKHLEQRYAKGNAEMRDDFVQPDPATRLKESVSARSSGPSSCMAAWTRHSSDSSLPG
jgi:hypothetical protein